MTDSIVVLPEVADGAVRPAARASLLAAITRSIGNEFPRYAAAFIGANRSRTKSASELLFVAILRRLARRATTPAGAARLFSELADPRIESDLLAAVNRMLGDGPVPEGEGLAAGEQAAHALFGRWTGSLVSQVGSTAGLDREAVLRLLGLATPLVYAALRDHVRERGLDAEALRQRLAKEFRRAGSTRRRPSRRAVAAPAREATPVVAVSPVPAREVSPVEEVVSPVPAREVSSVEVASPAPAREVSPLEVVSPAPVRGLDRTLRHDRRPPMRAGALLAVIAVAVAIAWQSQASRTDASAGPERPATVESGRGGSRDAGVDRLRRFLASDAAEVEFVFALDRVRFEPASAMLKSESNAQLGRLAAALAEYPEARIAIAVHALEAGEDGALAESRALAVRAALASFGIQLSRMTHAGGGDVSRPDSRIEARVTKG